MMFKILVLQALYDLLDDQAEFVINDRLSFMRFLGLGLGDKVPYDGAQLSDLVSRQNTASGVWADTAYCSKKNEEWLEKNGFASNVHRRKPKGRPMWPMSKRASRANGKRSKVRALVAHPFAAMKSVMGMAVRTVGLSRATVKLGMINLAYNFRRLAYLEGQTAPG